VPERAGYCKSAWTQLHNTGSAGAARHHETARVGGINAAMDRRRPNVFCLHQQAEKSMATFITTIKFTEQGIQNIHESPKRAAAFKSAAKKMGVKVTDIYWTLGSFDGVVILDAPDDETATAAMLHLASLGNVHTATARAFNSSEIEKVFGLLAKK
jgi:uncharacterized protein with GYD domain